MTKRLADMVPSAYRWLYWLMLACLPFSVAYSTGQHQLNLPAEPLILLLSVLLGICLQSHRSYFAAIWKAPITLVSLLYLGWMAVCIFFSSNLLVSLKYWLVTVAHWWVFYVGSLLMMHLWPKDIAKSLLCYLLPFLLIMLYAWTIHAQYGFRMDTSVLVARPFYFDHALYSCCMLLLIGFSVAWLACQTERPGRGARNAILLILLLLIAGVFLSFSRAAWLSAFVSALWVGSIGWLRLEWKGLLVLLLTLLLGGYWMLSRTDIADKAESKNYGIANQILSIGNLRTDVSNLERLNRYSCAWRMFLDRPITGYGPGTFQIAYLPYQKPEEMTRISVTHTGPHPPGRGGGAHSEYLQALSEMGLPGFLLLAGLLLIGLQRGLCLLRHTKDRIRRMWVLGILFALLTFFVHGLVNNFMHHDKVAVLVWWGMAMLTYLQKP